MSVGLHRFTKIKSPAAGTDDDNAKVAKKGPTEQPQVSAQAQWGKMLRGLNLRYEKRRCSFVRPGLMLEPKRVTTATSHAQEKTIRTQRLVRDESQIWHGGTDMGRFRPGRQHAGTR